MLKCPLRRTSLGEKMDSSVAHAAGPTLDHHWWDPRKDRVNTLAPVVAAGGGWPLALWELVCPLTGVVFSPVGCPTILITRPRPSELV